MTNTRFLQIHSLTGYSGALLNRDDSGLAKRINYGGETRTRVSSQCLKRHWRTADDEQAIDRTDGIAGSIRSRDTVTRLVIAPLKDQYGEEVAGEIDKVFQAAVYGDKGVDQKGRQPLLLGRVEIDYLAAEARKIAEGSGGDAGKAKKAAAEWARTSKANLKAFRDGTKAPGGVVAALFGRMVTADVDANIDAPIHVAHAFTVHGEDSESDYFTVVDDLKNRDESGTAHIGETEVSSGLFYGYVVVDLTQLLENVDNDTKLAGELVRRLVHLIATVSPGAKRGPTAPYSYANWMLIEAGNRQPRTLAEAFRSPCPAAPRTEAQERAEKYLTQLDAVYGAEETRKAISIDHTTPPGATRAGSLTELADWAAGVARKGSAE